MISLANDLVLFQGEAETDCRHSGPLRKTVRSVEGRNTGFKASEGNGLLFDQLTCLMRTIYS